MPAEGSATSHPDPADMWRGGYRWTTLGEADFNAYSQRQRTRGRVRAS